MTAALWGNLPLEMRERIQWVVAEPVQKIPCYVDGDGQMHKASSTDPRTWMSYNWATYHAHQRGIHIGYVLHKNDPFTCIDFDVIDGDSQTRKGQAVDPSKWTKQSEYNEFLEYAYSLATYTEVSVWGKGLHVWVRGKIGEGLRRRGVEIYSQERYILCTGNVIVNLPIAERQDHLDAVLAQIRAENPPEVALAEVAQLQDDASIHARLMSAENASKAVPLWEGRWQELGYPSQSEADLALMSMLTFYSPSNEQCRRIFRASALGQRPKAIKDNRYLNYTLKIIRARQAYEQAQEEQGYATAKELAKNELARMEAARLNAGTSGPTGPGSAAPAQVAVTMAAPVAPEVVAAHGELEWPPGCTGALAAFIYQSAPRPVKEVAIVAALGLLAGITGKAWHIKNSGLNIYVILVAKSAIGKEAMHSGIAALCKSVLKYAPSIMRFICFNSFASGQALIKHCAINDSFLHINGEWGQRLKAFSDDATGKNPSLNTLRTTMIDLYQKSGPQAIVGGITYSNADNNIEAVSGVAYSMIGETTPKAFYESLSEDMMENGFLSRFTTITHEGDRPPLNMDQHETPPAHLVEYFGALCKRAEELLSRGQSVEVHPDKDGKKLYADFEIECDKQINSSNDERWRQMWNRASLKVMRIASIMAVADNWNNPVVSAVHVTWAQNVVRRDIQMMIERLKSGDIGTGDDTRDQKLLSVIYDAVVNGATAGYNIPDGMLGDGVVPYTLLQKRTARVSVFYKARQGGTQALKQTVQSLIDGGYITEMAAKDTTEKYAFKGKCYRIARALEEFKQF